MTRKLNVRLLLLLVGGAALAGVGLFFLHRVQVGRSAGVLLELSRAAETNEDADRARRYLERYLAYRPRDLEATVRLADLLEKGGGRQSAARVLEKALPLDPTRHDLRLRVARAYLDARAFSRAKPHLDRLLDPLPKDADVHEAAEINDLAGRAEEGLSRYADAEPLYVKAIQLDPTRVEAYERLADVLRRLNHPDEADAIMDVNADAPGGLIASAGDSPKAHLARARYRERNGLPGTDADVAKALALAPEDPDALLAAAVWARDRGELAAARKYLAKALDVAPGREVTYQILADMDLKAGEPAKAVAWMEKGVAAAPKSATMRYSLAGVLAQVGRVEESRALARGLKEEGLAAEFSHQLAAAALMREKKWPEAAEEFEKAQLNLVGRADPESRARSKQTLLSLCECYAQSGRQDDRYDAARRAVAIELEGDALWAAARIQLAAALQAQGKVDEAIREYLATVPRAPSLRLPAARLLTLRNLRLPEAERRWGDAEKLVDDTAKDPKSDAVEVAAARAEILVAQGKVDEARAELESARGLAPKRVEPWLALAGLAEKQGRDGLALLRQAEAALGPRPELRRALALAWGRKTGPEAAAALAALEREADALPPEEKAQLRLDVARGYAQAGDAKRANALWKALAEERADNPDVQLAALEVALAAGDRPAARARADRLRALEGERGDLYKYGEARILIDEARRPGDRRAPALDEARTLLAEVAASRPSWARVEAARGEAAALAGDEAAALAHYTRAIDDLEDRVPGDLAAAAALAHRQKDHARAERMIALLRERGLPITGALQRIVAEIAFQNRDYARALEQAQLAVPDDAADPASLIWLGRIQWAAGRDASKALRRAVELDPKRPDARLALIGYLAAKGTKPEAEAELARAAEALPPDVAAPVLAEGNVALGRPERALTIYDEALKARPGDLAALRGLAALHFRAGRIPEATARLRELAAAHPGTEAASVARRTLALAAAGGGGAKAAAQALEILGLPQGGEAPAAPTAAGPDLDDLRTQARVLAMQPSRARRQEAIKILDQVAERGGGARPADLYLAAQLHEANGSWDESRKIMQGLLASANPAPEHLYAFARGLLRHGGAAEARPYLARLEAAAPGRPATIELQARVLHAEGRDPEAVALLNRYAEQGGGRVRFAAERLEEIGQHGPAERLFRQHAEAGAAPPEASLPLIGFLGRRKDRLDDALDLIDAKIWPRMPAAVASNASVVLLYGARSSDAARFDRVARKIEEALKKPGAAPSLEFDMANVLALQGLYDEAAAIYNRIAERDPSRGAPLNNLAWMSALRDSGEEALRVVAKAIEIDGETPDLLDTRALARLALNQPKPAIRDLEDALAVTPNNAELTFHLARAYRMAGRDGDARDALRKAQTLGLTVEKLHPLERPGFDELVKVLGKG